MLRRFARWESEGRSFATAVVVETHGSCPRKAGARLALTDSGELVGTIGGGKVEKDVIDRAKEMLAENAPPRIMEFSMNAPRDDASGMLCGGTMTVFIEVHACES